MKKILLIILALFAVISCARYATHPAKLKEVEKRQTFTVKGEVLWKGPAPIVYPIPTAAYRGACGKRQAQWVLRLKKARKWHMRLLDVAVWLEPVWEEMMPEEIVELRARQKARYRDPVEIVERECQFNPRIIMVPVGTRIEVTNEDRKDHWFILEGEHRPRKQYVQYYGETPSVFTFETPGVHNIPKGQPASLVADRVDKWHLISGFHQWMEAWVVVTEKAWFDEMVDNKGIFEISDVPKGVYRIHTWHPLLGQNTSKIRVPEDTRRLIAVNYNEEPYKHERVPSTVITTFGEVRQEKDVWQSIDDW